MDGAKGAYYSEREPLKRAAERAKALVRRRALLAAGAAGVAPPGVDVLVDAASLADLLARINRLFLLAPEDAAKLSTEERIAVARALEEVGARFAGRSLSGFLVLEALKAAGSRWAGARVASWVPVAGRVAAASLSYYLFHRLGTEHINECLRVRTVAALRLGRSNGF